MFNNVLCAVPICLSKVEMSKVSQQLCVSLVIAADKVEGARYEDNDLCSCSAHCQRWANQTIFKLLI
jgi:hypothetical protein